MRLTNPGPFGPRTIELGRFVGIHRDGRMVAMAGERLKPEGHTEITGVCTDPDHRGRGYSRPWSPTPRAIPSPRRHAVPARRQHQQERDHALREAGVRAPPHAARHCAQPRDMNGRVRTAATSCRSARSAV